MVNSMRPAELPGRPEIESCLGLQVTPVSPGWQTDRARDFMSIIPRVLLSESMPGF